jgi:signal peptidase I
MAKEATKTVLTYAASFVFSLVFLLIIFCINTQALNIAPVSTFCDENDTPTYSAYIRLESGEYEVYGKMGKSGQAAQSSVYSQSDESGCALVGNTILESQNWKKVGSLDIAGAETQTQSLFLASAGLDELTDANRPTLMIIPRIDPVCIPTNECNVTIGGSPGYIRAAGTLLNEESLHVVKVVDPAVDTIKKVEYFVGNRLAYTKPALEKFDLRYVPGGRQQISRIITYASRQKVVLPETVEQSTFNGFKNYLFSLWTGNKIGILVLLVTGAVVIALTVLLKVRRYLYHRTMWKRNHDARYQPVADRTDEAVVVDNRPPFTKEDPRWAVLLIKLRPYLFGFIIFTAAMITANTFVFRLFQVDGVSMQSTLHTGQKLYINKLGKTWSGLNGKEYVPKRGEVVVFHRVQSIEFEPGGISESEKEYMVKRVLGLPGERVVLKKGVVTIYNDTHPEGFNPDESGSWNKKMHVGSNDNIDIRLSQSEVFVAGDNRPESVDSRYNGPIETKEIIGDALGVVWPLGQITGL